MLHTEWDPPQKSWKLFIWILPLPCEGCDAPVTWWGRNLAIGFLDKINLFIYLFFNICNICVCVFCGERGFICMISSVWLIVSCDYSEWGQYECRSAVMDYMAHICMIIICIMLHISVWLLTNSNQCEWLTISVYVWQSVYVLHRAIFILSFFLLLKSFKILLILFFSGQINHLYDV